MGTAWTGAETLPDFTVTKLHGQGNPWSTKDGKGPFIPHRFEVEGTEGMVEWSRKEGSPGPSVGEVLSGDLSQTQYGWKFKKAQSNGGGFAGKSPEQQRSIVRQHSAEMALRYAAIRAGQGKLPDDFSLEQLRPVIDWFVRDAGS